MNAVVISCASCSGELPVGTKPVVGLLLPDVTTTTTAAAAAITTAATAAMMTFRLLPLLPPPPCRACLDGGPAPITGIGEVEGSDAYHGPDDLLPPESLVTHGKVPTRKFSTNVPVMSVSYPDRVRDPTPVRNPERAFPLPLSTRCRSTWATSSTPCSCRL